MVIVGLEEDFRFAVCHESISGIKLDSQADINFIFFNIETSQPENSMATCYSNHMENYLGYVEREKLRDEEAVRVNKARGMLCEDFMDRVYLFMSDLCELQEGDGLDSLPHGELYFNEKEMRQLASISRLCDPSATPQEILNSLEAVVPNFRFKVEGVWHYPTAEYIDWVRYEKECVPGTLRGIYADALAEILPEEDLREMEERREDVKSLVRGRKLKGKMGKATLRNLPSV